MDDHITLSANDVAVVEGLRSLANQIASGALIAVSYGRGIGDTRDIEQHVFEMSRVDKNVSTVVTV